MHSISSWRRCSEPHAPAFRLLVSDGFGAVSVAFTCAVGRFIGAGLLVFNVIKFIAACAVAVFTSFLSTFPLLPMVMSAGVGKAGVERLALLLRVAVRRRLRGRADCFSSLGGAVKALSAVGAHVVAVPSDFYALPLG